MPLELPANVSEAKIILPCEKCLTAMSQAEGSAATKVVHLRTAAFRSEDNLSFQSLSSQDRKTFNPACLKADVEHSRMGSAKLGSASFAVFINSFTGNGISRRFAKRSDGPTKL